jgi:hypothetical protein
MPYPEIIIEGDTARKYMSEMKPYRKKVGILAVRIDRPFSIIQHSEDAAINGEITAEAGSWLAQGINGVLYPIANDAFEAMYERDDL